MATRAEMIAQIRNTAPELLAGVDVNALEDSYITRMLQDANRLAYMDRSLAAQQKNPNQVYAFTNPADYFQAYGTIPVDFQGSSGYYDTKEKSQDIRYLTPDANATYALVSPKSGQVLGTGAGQQGLLDLATQANNLNYELGREADWQLQKVGPGGQTEVIGTNKYNSDRTLLGKIFGPILDVGLPILTSALIPGAGFLNTALQAAAGSAVASAANDRSLEDTLKRAALTGVTAGIGEKLMGPRIPTGASDAAISANVSNAINAAYQAAQQGAASSLGSIYGSALGGVGAGVGSVAGSAAGSAAGQTAAQTAAQKAAQEAAQKFGEEIFVTGIRNTAPNLVSSAIAGAAPSIFDAIAQKYPSYTPPSSQSTTPQNNFGDEIVVNAQVPSKVPGITSSLLGGAASTALPEVGPLDTPANKSLLSKLTANMGLLDYLTLGSLAGSALGSIAGGGGTGSGTGTPYVSPFGAGPAFGAGTDMRATPAIEDYERYGFGPEATFFRPEYNRLVSGASQPKSTAMPTYTPLLNG